MRSLLTVAALCASAICSPTGEDWTALNVSLSGHLYTSRPVELPCFPTYEGHVHHSDAAVCSAIRSDYLDPYFRANSFAIYQQAQSSMCLSNATDQCLLDNVDGSPAPLPAANASCNQGNTPSYYVDIHGETDVSVAFAFAAKHGVALSIKNSGHDYVMRNVGKDTLGLWTRNLRNLSYESSFVPRGCTGSQGQRAITVGGGVNFDEVYAFAYSQNVTYIGGYASTIGASGGWLQAGGHSTLSPVYGLGADRVLQFKVVTPDGALRIANQCQHTDLFWALRGGGGGTFGVVLESTSLVEPAMPIAVASISLPKNATKASQLQWLELMVDSSVAWGKEGWGGHITSNGLVNMNPLLDLAAAKASVRNASTFASSLGGKADIKVVPSWWEVYQGYVVPGQATTGGMARFLNNRLTPTKMFESADGRGRILNYLQQILDFPASVYIPFTTPFLWRGDSSTTAVNPAYYSSLWEVSMHVDIAWDSSYNDRLSAMTKLTSLTRAAAAMTGPGGGAYMNEANPFTQQWKQDFWGANYDKLVTVKNKYDPTGLLTCWKCIGFENKDMLSVRFRCQGQMQQAIDSALA
jgi:FAD/FMN-containing dehydrogenase